MLAQTRERLQGGVAERPRRDRVEPGALGLVGLAEPIERLAAEVVQLGQLVALGLARADRGVDARERVLGAALGEGLDQEPTQGLVAHVPVGVVGERALVGGAGLVGLVRALP